MTSRKQNFFKWILVIFVVASVACSAAPEIEEVVVTREVIAVTVENQPVEIEVTRVVTEVEVVEVTATPEGVLEEPLETKSLIVCGANEPDSLYPYGRGPLYANDVYDAIYTRDFTTLSFNYQAEGLQKLPSLVAGDAIINEVFVESGDSVVNADGEIVTLEDGVRLINANGEPVEFDGTPILLEQMVVDFIMKQRYWSDGVPVTAVDSVFSFEMDAHPDSPTNKFLTDRTESYEATNELSTRWTGLPGFRDATFFINFWQPLPKHDLQEFSAEDLLEVVDSNREPLSDGPFMIDEWVEGEYIRFMPNPFYYRSDEGLPYLDEVIYKFIEDDNELLAQMLAEECDIVPRIHSQLTPFMIEAENNGLLRFYSQIGNWYEHIDFGINSYGDYGDGIGRPDWFEDVRTRQAITMCTDRQRMVDEILYGRSQVIHTYNIDFHPVYPEDVFEWPYDIEQGNNLLDEVGFVDSDGDGWREDPITGEPFRVTMGTTANSDWRRQIIEMFKENMVSCGIDVELYFQPSRDFFADGPDGILFGRQFDLGQFAWVMTTVEPSCDLFISDNITGPEEEGYGGWHLSGNTGWVNDEFDEACKLGERSLLGSTEFTEGHHMAQRIFSEELPIMPLFMMINAAASGLDVVNFSTDATESSLYNIYEIDLQEPAN